MEQISKSLKDNSVKSDLNSSFEFIASKVNATKDEYFKVEWDLKEAKQDNHFAKKNAMKTEIHIGSCDLNSPKLDDSKAINNEYVKEDVAEINIEKKVVSNPMKTEKQIGYCELNSPKNDASKV
ncbi:hypothetical protein QVD17_38308 [Tagetes erecta]|uniref:Uncharacterized protein n=1 Tax=Tagetes erecta TaxID=13708 RepID=A0AAD8JLH4_TARER|nr:hypothetical protein QVD17_38308 [Tagetes erecta]